MYGHILQFTWVITHMGNKHNIIWNWQQNDWPNFNYDNSLISEYERVLLFNSGILLGTQKHISNENKSYLVIEIISNEAVTTSEI